MDTVNQLLKYFIAYVINDCLNWSQLRIIADSLI